MTPDDVDRELYYWIQVANESRDRFLLPVGLIEESIAHLESVLGQAFLATVFQKTEQPIALLVGDEVNPLRLWLGSPGVDRHILQVLEFCASLRTFANDGQLDGKIEKLKRDAFHPIFFELAIAHRLNASASPHGAVALSAENDEAVGDFSLHLERNLLACECSRLGFGPREDSQFRILNLVYDYIADFAKNNPGNRLI